MDIQFVDFDNVRFHLSTGEARNLVTLSMGIKCWPDLVKYGAEKHLKETYGDALQAQAEPEHDVSIEVDLDKIPSDASGSRSHCIN